MNSNSRSYLRQNSMNFTQTYLSIQLQNKQNWTLILKSLRGLNDICAGVSVRILGIFIPCLSSLTFDIVCKLSDNKIYCSSISLIVINTYCWNNSNNVLSIRLRKFNYCGVEIMWKGCAGSYKILSCLVFVYFNQFTVVFNHWHWSLIWNFVTFF